MPVQLLSIGPLTTLIKDVVYALPAVQCMLTVTDSGIEFVLEVSGDPNFTNKVDNYQPVNSNIETHGGFIRTTFNDINIVLRRGTHRRSPALV